MYIYIYIYAYVYIYIYVYVYAKCDVPQNEGTLQRLSPWIVHKVSMVHRAYADKE